MGQKKHHQSSLRTTTLVTTRSRAAKLAARPDKTHGSIESEKRLLPRTQPRPVAEDEIFALPFLHAPTRDHSVYNLSRDEDTHGVPPHRPSASEWATWLWFFKIFNTKMASAEARCFRKHRQSAAPSPRTSSRFIASSGGAAVLVTHRYVEAALREHARHRFQSHAPVLHFPGAMLAGSCLFAMVATVTGRKTAPQERICAQGRQCKSDGCVQSPCLLWTHDLNHDDFVAYSAYWPWLNHTYITWDIHIMLCLDDDTLNVEEAISSRRTKHITTILFKHASATEFNKQRFCMCVWDNQLESTFEYYRDKATYFCEVLGFGSKSSGFTVKR